jgi:hypothetical protein
MAAGAARARLRAWFAGQVQARSDGFLVRPLGRWGSVVALPDEDAACEYVERRISLTLREVLGRCVSIGLALIAFAAVLLDLRANQALPLTGPWFSVVLAAIFTLPLSSWLFVRWQVHRWACRIGRPVSRTLWCGDAPPESVPIPLLPGWFIAVAGGLVGVVSPALMGVAVWVFAGLLPGMTLGLGIWFGLALVIGLCWATAGVIAWQWWRANRRAA